MKQTIRRGLAGCLALLMLLTGIPVMGAEEELAPEQMATGVYNADLAGLTTSAGMFTTAFRSSQYSYELLLTGPEDVFTLTAQPDYSGAVVTIDGATGQSRSYELARGHGRRITINVTSENGKANTTYRVKALHADTEVVARRSLVADVGGAPQLKLELTIPRGTEFNSWDMSFNFDPKVLQLADAATNVATTTRSACISFVDDIIYRTSNRNNPMAVVSETSVQDNANGAVRFGLAPQQSKPEGTSYTVGENTVIATIYFRVVDPEAALDSNALSLKFATLGQVTRLIDGGDTERMLVELSHAGLVRAEGLLYQVTLPTAGEGGGVTASAPDVGSAYSHGRTLTIRPQADSGYQFHRWEADAAATALLGGEAALERETLSLRVTQDLDLSGLRPVFELSDQLLPSERQLDLTAPYMGDQLVAVNRAYEGTATVGGGTFEEAEVGDHLDGLTGESGSLQGTAEAVDVPAGSELSGYDSEGQPVLSVHEEALEAEEAAPVSLLGVETPLEEGMEQTFRGRDKSADQGSVAGWQALRFTLMAIRPAGDSQLYVWACTDEAYPDWQTGLTPGAFTELADSFADSYGMLAANYGTVGDKDGNGGLNILLYNIHENTVGAYYQGFFNSNEYFGPLGGGSYKDMGNRGDFLHLDTDPTGLEDIKSTFAHEAQHAIFASVGGFKSSKDMEKNGPPTWINEGLSLSVEHVLFGRQDSRIRFYNSSEQIKNGWSLTRWDANAAGSLNNYALAYLFFQYVRTQSGSNDWAKTFYGRYQDPEAAVTDRLTALDCFQGMDFGEIVQNFYLALLLQEDKGPYGFNGADFSAVQARLLEQTQMPVSLPEASAVYVNSPGRYRPAEGNGGVSYAGVTQPRRTLTVTDAEGGGVTVDGVVSADGRYTYIHGETVQLLAQPDEGWRFSHWEGALSGTAAQAELTLDGDKTVTAVFEEIPRYRLTLDYDAACGSVALSPAQPPEGYLEDERVALTVSVNENCRFLGWSGDASGTEETISLTMDGDKTVTARLEGIPRYHLALDYDRERGKVTVSPEEPEGGYLEGETVELIAELQSAEAEFLGWSGVDAVDGMTATVAMDGNKAVTANFQAIPRYHLTLDYDQSRGTVTAEPEEPEGGYLRDTEVKLTAGVIGYNTFYGWTGAASGDGATVTVTMDGDKTVTAAFEAIPRYQLTLDYDTACGQVALAPERPEEGYLAGTEVTLTAAGVGNGVFQSWGGVDKENGTTATVTMNSDRTVTAAFETVPRHELQLSWDEAWGQVLLTPEQPQGGYLAGTEVTVEAKPGENGLFEGWTGNFAGQGRVITLTMDSERTAVALFREKQKLTPAEILGLDAATKPGDVVVEKIGETVTVTVTKRDGAGRIQGSVVMVSTGFEEDGAGDLVIPEDAQATLRAQPAEGMQFLFWRVQASKQIQATQGSMAEQTASLAAQGLAVELADMEAQGEPVDLTDPQITAPLNMQYQPVFAPETLATGEGLYLMELRLDEYPEAEHSWGLIQATQGRKPQFESAVKDYELYVTDQDLTLGSADLTFYAVAKSGGVHLQAEAWIAYADGRVSAPVPIADRGPDQTLTPIALTGVTPGDVLHFKVWDDGGPELGLTDNAMEYTVAVKKLNPDLQAKLQDGMLTITTQNLALWSGTITLTYDPFTMVDQTDWTAYFQEHAVSDAGYQIREVVKADEERPSKRIRTLTITFAWPVGQTQIGQAPEIPTQRETLMALPLPFEEDGEEGLDKKIQISLEDSRLLGLKTTVEIVTGDVLQGVVTAYNLDTPIALTVLDAQGDLVRTTATFTRDPDDTAQDYQRCRFRFNIEGLTVGGRYTLLFTKSGHTSVTIDGYTFPGMTDWATAEDTRLHVLELYAGDLDGDGWVSVFDADRLAGNLWAKDWADAGYALCNLDGDERVDTLDLDILTGKDNYGKRAYTITLTDTEGGEAHE